MEVELNEPKRSGTGSSRSRRASDLVLGILAMLWGMLVTAVLTGGMEWAYRGFEHPPSLEAIGLHITAGLLFAAFVLGVKGNARLNLVLQRLESSVLIPLRADGVRPNNSIVAGISEITAALEGQAVENHDAGVRTQCAVLAMRHLADQIRKGTYQLAMDRGAIGGPTPHAVELLIRECATAADEVIATCHTHMDSFWCVKDIGAQFMQLNLDLLRRDRIGRLDMRRIFRVNGSKAFDPADCRMFQIASMLRLAGADCRYLRADDKAADPRAGELRNDLDMFVMLSGRKPLIALGWVLDAHHNLQRVECITDVQELERMVASFDYQWTRAKGGADWSTYASVPLYRPDDYPKPTEDGGSGLVSIVRLLASDQVSRNTSEYLRSLPQDQISEDSYWEGLQDTIVRPSHTSVEWFERRLSEIQAGRSSSSGPVRVACLGCTPELRNLFAKVFPERNVHVVDINPVMFDITHPLLNPGVASHEKKHCTLWETFHLAQENRNAFDVVAGVDCLNMLDSDAQSRLLGACRKLLKHDGSALFEVIQFSKDRQDLKLHEELGRAGLARFVERRISEDLSDILVDLAYAHAVAPNLVLDLPNAAEVLEQELRRLLDRESAGTGPQRSKVEADAGKIGWQYRYCNSRLVLLGERNIATMASVQGFGPLEDVRSGDDGKRRFTKEMLLFRLQPLRPSA